MMDTQRMFVPAAGREWLLPIYDPLTRLLGVDDARRALIAQADLQPLHRVLDVGCGTGTLAILVRTLHPAVRVTGLDPDRKALARAQRKALRAGVLVEWNHGFSDALPYSDATFDRVFSSMMFHHLDLREKQRTLQEIHRVLEPGGRLQMLDFAGPESAGGHGPGRWLHTHRRLRDNGEQRVLGLMADAGFASPEKVADRRILFGRLACYQASCPR